MKPAIILGKRLLTPEAYAAQTAALATSTGAVGLGKVLQKEFVSRSKQVVAKDHNTATDRDRVLREAERLALSGKASVPANSQKPKGRRAKGEAEVSFSENDVATMLTTDANLWNTVLEEEAKRPEGPRLRVLELVRDAAPRATERPIPAEVMATIEAALVAP